MVTWAKLDDTFWMHPKVMLVGNAGAGIFARMLAYSGCYLTDGLIPEYVVKTIVGTEEEALQSLLDVHMLERLPSGAVAVRNYLEHNPPKVKVDADRKQRRENGSKGGRPRKDQGL